MKPRNLYGSFISDSPHTDLKHFCGGEQGGGGIGDVLPCRRIEGVLRPRLKHGQICTRRRGYFVPCFEGTKTIKYFWQQATK